MGWFIYETLDSAFDNKLELPCLSLEKLLTQRPLYMFCNYFSFFEVLPANETLMDASDSFMLARVIIHTAIFKLRFYSEFIL